MLVLWRGRDLAIQTGADITIDVLKVHRRGVKLGIHAPNEFLAGKESVCCLPVTAIPVAPSLLYDRRRLRSR